MVKIATSVTLFSLSLEFASVFGAPVIASEDSLQAREPGLFGVVIKGAAAVAKSGTKEGAKEAAKSSVEVAADKAQQKAQKREYLDEDDLYVREYFEIDELD